jgi:hypothetical protein
MSVYKHKHYQSIIHHNKINNKLKFIQTPTLMKFHKILKNKLKIKQLKKKPKLKKIKKFENDYYIKRKY